MTLTMWLVFFVVVMPLYALAANYLEKNLSTLGSQAFFFGTCFGLLEAWFMEILKVVMK